MITNFSGALSNLIPTFLFLFDVCRLSLIKTSRNFVFRTLKEYFFQMSEKCCHLMKIMIFGSEIFFILKNIHFQSFLGINSKIDMIFALAIQLKSVHIAHFWCEQFSSLVKP